MRMLRANFLKRARDKRGFTLIELLVVISIISLLSSVVLASLNTARNKAKVGAGKQFYSSLHNAIGIDLIGEWKFENAGSGFADDTSGYGNTGVLAAGASQVPASTCGLGLGGCGQFNGTDTGYMTSSDDAFDIGAGKDFTVSVWINSTQSAVGGYWPLFVYKVGNAGGTTGYEMALYNETTKAWYAQIWSAGSNTYCQSGDVGDGIWHHLVMSRADNKLVTYTDGAQTCESGGAPTADLSNSHLFTVGGNYNWMVGSAYLGLIDEVRIYSSALTAQEVGKIYAEGRVTHPLAKAK
jgi:prepilin-type N-terminal cleavage/methylation domain-containing protein